MALLMATIRRQVIQAPRRLMQVSFLVQAICQCILHPVSCHFKVPHFVGSRHIMCQPCKCKHHSVSRHFKVPLLVGSRHRLCQPCQCNHHSVRRRCKVPPLVGSRHSLCQLSQCIHHSVNRRFKVPLHVGSRHIMCQPIPLHGIISVRRRRRQCHCKVPHHVGSRHNTCQLMTCKCHSWTCQRMHLQCNRQCKVPHMVGTTAIFLQVLGTPGHRMTSDPRPIQVITHKAHWAHHNNKGPASLKVSIGPEIGKDKTPWA